MSYDNWSKFKIEDLGEVVSGGTPSTKNADFWNGDISWITPKDLASHNSVTISRGERSITKLGLDSSSAKLMPKNSVLFSSRAPIGYVAIADCEVATNQGFKNIVTNDNFDHKFVYYLLKYNTDSIKNISGGSTFSEISGKVFKAVEVFAPSLQEQKAISNILSSLDDKIELNNKINKNLEEMVQALYKQWFVDFEFPNEHGEPYKSSGGEMIESELGLIPKGWKVRFQKEYFPVVTGKKDANIATIEGEYKFFTCSQKASLTDVYSFEGKAILVAGNGDFNVKYYDGKFEAYQRTYVLIPNNQNISGLLYFSIKNNLDLITQESRGSVIKFITKGHIENFKIALPSEMVLEEMTSIFNDSLVSISNYETENEKLSELKNTLLPKLMSGEIEVPIKG